MLGPVANVLVIEHEEGAGLCSFEPWFRSAGLEADVVRPHNGDAVPSAPGHDALVVLGGRMGANDDAEFPWLADAKRLLRSYVERAAPCLGVCLGHQLLAVAAGGEVRPSPAGTQIGLREVGLLPAAAGDELLGGLAADVRSVHWNADVVTRLPGGAELLARSADGYPQAYRLGRAAWGVQFHPEVDAAGFAGWAAGEGAAQSRRGIDVPAAVSAVRAADDELARTWRPLAERFARLATAVRQY